VAPIVLRYKWIKRLLELPRINGWIVFAGMLLLAPSLNTGISADDYVHRLILSQSGEIEGFIRSPWDLFRFTKEGSVELLKRDGVVAWWDDPNAVLAFWRPVSAMTHYLDYQLWPDSDAMMHLHSLFWALIVFLGIRLLYKDLVTPPWMASLALLLYVFDDTRAWFGSWVAARNAVVATAFSIWALVCHHRYVVQRWRPGAILAPPLFALALLSGEGAISICAYLFAHALFIDQGKWTNRLAKLLSYLVVAVVWRTTYIALGYGVVGSGLYADPLQNPWPFTLGYLEHAPILLFSQWGGIWSDLWTSFFVYPRFSKVLMATAVAFIAVCAILFIPLLKRDRVVRFGILGAVLSTFPASTTFTSDRLLTWIAIGASIALARFIGLYIQDRKELGLSAGLSRIAPAFMLIFVVMNIIVAPPLLVSRARGNIALREIVNRADRSVPRDDSISDKVLIYVNPPGVPLASYIPIMRAVTGVPRAKAQFWLATSTSEVRLDRLDARTLKVRPRDGFLLNPADRLLRSSQRPIRLDEEFDLGYINIRVTELTDDRRPAEIVVHFSMDLEDPSILWLCWNRVRYNPCKPPKLGEKIILPSADFMEVILGVKTPVEMRYTPENNDF
jgi:hypothetical protein